MTPAQLHKQREEARRASAAAAESDGELQGSQYDLMLNQLAQQKRAISAIKSLTARQTVKQEALDEWVGYIEGVLEADSGAQDQIIGQLLIWSIDTGNYDQALTLGEYMLRHDLTLPEHFVRPTEEALAEELAEAWIKSDAPTVTVEQLRRAEELVGPYDMHDEIRAKLYRALGEAEYNADQPLAAIVDLRTALALNPKVGCKQLLTKLEKDHPEFDPEKEPE